MPASHVSAIDSAQDDGPLPPVAQADDGDLFQAAVLFTDMRGSSDLVNRVPPREFFRLLNGSLSAQAATVGAHGGTVVKYTGDGLLAVFRGPSRATHAVRCALALAEAGGREPRLPFGVGVVDGPVLAGLLGPDTPGQRRQPDVVGATVHMAARMCALAAAGEVVTTRATLAGSGLQLQLPCAVETLALPGFPAPVDCVVLDTGGAPLAADPGPGERLLPSAQR